MTATRAFSARRRASSKLGKELPCRSLGIRGLIIPTRVSHSLNRYRLRHVTRSGVRSPHAKDLLRLY